MKASALSDVLKQDVKLEEIEEGIFSCLPAAQRPSAYDTKARAYDAVVGNRVYNRLLWGNWPSRYESFCRQALGSAPDGIVLDAGCGSLVFTADAYCAARNKLIVLLDRSLGMLRRGRDRLQERRGAVPNNVVMIQGNIFSLPFRDAAFDAVASFGMLHLFDDKSSLLDELERVRRPHGQVFFSSLVGDNALGRKYLGLLAKAAEVAAPHSSASLREFLARRPVEYELTTVGNMVYGKSA